MSNRTANKNNINLLPTVYANLSNHDAQKQAHDPQTLSVHVPVHIAHTAISTTRSHHGRTRYVHVHVHVYMYRVVYCVLTGNSLLKVL